MQSFDHHSRQRVKSSQESGKISISFEKKIRKSGISMVYSPCDQQITRRYPSSSGGRLLITERQRSDRLAIPSTSPRPLRALLLAMGNGRLCNRERVYNVTPGVHIYGQDGLVFLGASAAGFSVGLVLRRLVRLCNALLEAWRPRT